jgi:hypothetical protein
MASATEAIARVECFGRESAVERIRLEDLVLAREDARLKEIMAQAWYARARDALVRSTWARTHRHENLGAQAFGYGKDMTM